MTAQRPGPAGATRTCPHCKETILDSAAVCPVCRHHLRFDSSSSDAAASTITPLRVEASIRQPLVGGSWEYSMVLTIRNQHGEDIARKIIGVGALQPDEQRSFTLSVEMTPSAEKGIGKRGT